MLCSTIKKRFIGINGKCTENIGVVYRFHWLLMTIASCTMEKSKQKISKTFYRKKVISCIQVNVILFLHRRHRTIHYSLIKHDETEWNGKERY